MSAPPAALERRRPRARGAVAVEFFVVMLLVLLPLSLGILQLAVLQSARHALEYATFLAARAGSVTHGSRAEMQRHLARGLAALHVRVPLEAGAGAGPLAAADVAAAAGAAWLEVRRPDRVRLDILNPTAASFAAFEAWRDGVLEIPNDGAPAAIPVGGAAADAQTIREANVLKIRVSRCHRLVFPLVDRMIVGLLRWLDPDPFAQLCYAEGGVVLRAQALQPMQSAPRRDAMGL